MIDLKRGDVLLVWFPNSAQATGLRTDSVIMTDNLATVLHQAIAEKIGHLAALSEVNQALRATLGL